MSLQTRISMVCVTLMAAGGCVSRTQFDQVSADRQRTAVQLVLARGDVQVGHEANAQLAGQIEAANATIGESQARADETAARLASAVKSLAESNIALEKMRAVLGQTNLTLAVAQKDQAELALIRQKLAQTELAAAQSQQELNNAQTALAIAQLDQLKLAEARKTLAAVEQDRAQLRERLASSQAVAQELTRKTEGLSSELSRTRENYRRQTAEADAQLSKAQASLADAQKDRAELEQVRLKLIDSQQSVGLANSKLNESQKRIIDLQSRLESQTTQLKHLQDDARQAAAHAD